MNASIEHTTTTTVRCCQCQQAWPEHWCTEIELLAIDDDGSLQITDERGYLCLICDLQSV